MAHKIKQQAMITKNKVIFKNFRNLNFEAHLLTDLSAMLSLITYKYLYNLMEKRHVNCFF